jgi:hypothetical protein
MSTSEKVGDYGNEWRLLAHRGDEKLEIENQGCLDEVVVGEWLHMEQMDDNVWWLRIGDARLMVTLGAEGQPSVDIQRGFYAVPKGSTSNFEPPDDAQSG